MTESASATDDPSTSISEDADFAQLATHYNPIVSWPAEYTNSLEKANVRDAFRRTFKRIRQAGCDFLLLEPTETPGSLYSSLSDWIFVIMRI